MDARVVGRIDLAVENQHIRGCHIRQALTAAREGSQQNGRGYGDAQMFHAIHLEMSVTCTSSLLCDGGSAAGRCAHDRHRASLEHLANGAMRFGKCRVRVRAGASI